MLAGKAGVGKRLEKKREAVGGKLSKETSLNTLKDNTRPRSKREEILGKICSFYLAAMHTNAFPPPIHTRDGGSCCDPLPSPGINGTPPTHTGFSSSFIRTRRPLTCRIVVSTRIPLRMFSVVLYKVKLGNMIADMVQYVTF